MAKDYDFAGWATKNNLRCSDGRVIMKDAFAHNDGQTVPLVWNHEHNNPHNVLGHALLKNMSDGVYAYCTFNGTPSGQDAKLLVQHGDVKSLSIYANKLKQEGSNVIHGAIREVSLVLAGANPGAQIEAVFAHGDDEDEAAVIHCDDEIELCHEEEEQDVEETPAEESIEHADGESEKTIKDIYYSMTEEQKAVTQFMVGAVLKEKEAAQDQDDNNTEGDDTMSHNVFDTVDKNDTELMHAEQLETIIKDGKRYGTLKESFLAHSQEYGIENIDYLFPEAKNVTDKPIFIQRNMDWVSKVMNGVHRSPFARIKSMYADITEDAARAKGYIKGNLKKEEVFSLLKRTTTPTTIYKKQKLDRDDIIDITDFNVVAWLKTEMRMMLDEEIARAILIGDGRLASDNDKINESNIRPIAKDSDLFTVKCGVKWTTGKDLVTAFIKSRKAYKGSGNPVLFATEDVLTDMLLIEDTTGRKIYETEAQLKTAIRVSDIITVEVMEGEKGPNGGDMLGILINLNDYYVGADKGGAISMFEDFDIDYNQEKYLIETRCSGALVKPYSAIVYEKASAFSLSNMTDHAGNMEKKDASQTQPQG